MSSSLHRIIWMTIAVFLFVPYTQVYAQQAVLIPKEGIPSTTTNDRTTIGTTVIPTTTTEKEKDPTTTTPTIPTTTTTTPTPTTPLLEDEPTTTTPTTPPAAEPTTDKIEQETPPTTDDSPTEESAKENEDGIPKICRTEVDAPACLAIEPSKLFFHLCVHKDRPYDLKDDKCKSLEKKCKDKTDVGCVIVKTIYEQLGIATAKLSEQGGTSTEEGLRTLCDANGGSYNKDACMAWAIVYLDAKIAVSSLSQMPALFDKVIGTDNTRANLFAEAFVTTAGLVDIYFERTCLFKGMEAFHDRCGEKIEGYCESNQAKHEDGCKRVTMWTELWEDYKKTLVGEYPDYTKMESLCGDNKEKCLLLMKIVSGTVKPQSVGSGDKPGPFDKLHKNCKQENSDTVCQAIHASCHANIEECVEIIKKSCEKEPSEEVDLVYCVNDIRRICKDETGQSCKTSLHKAIDIYSSREEYKSPGVFAPICQTKTDCLFMLNIAIEKNRRDIVEHMFEHFPEDNARPPKEVREDVNEKCSNNENSNGSFPSACAKIFATHCTEDGGEKCMEGFTAYCPTINNGDCQYFILNALAKTRPMMARDIVLQACKSDDHKDQVCMEVKKIGFSHPTFKDAFTTLCDKDNYEKKENTQFCQKLEKWCAVADEKKPDAATCEKVVGVVERFKFDAAVCSGAEETPACSTAFTRQCEEHVESNLDNCKNLLKQMPLDLLFGKQEKLCKSGEQKACAPMQTILDERCKEDMSHQKCIYLLRAQWAPKFKIMAYCGMCLSFLIMCAAVVYYVCKARTQRIEKEAFDMARKPPTAAVLWWVLVYEYNHRFQTP